MTRGGRPVVLADRLAAIGWRLGGARVEVPPAGTAELSVDLANQNNAGKLGALAPASSEEGRSC